MNQNDCATVYLFIIFQSVIPLSTRSVHSSNNGCGSLLAIVHLINVSTWQPNNRDQHTVVQMKT